LSAKLYSQIGARDFGLVRLIDQVSDETVKRRIAAWEFQDLGQPSEPDFTRLARSLRSRWLCQAIARAEEAGQAAEAKRLRAEHFELRRKLLQRDG